MLFGRRSGGVHNAIWIDLGGLGALAAGCGPVYRDRCAIYKEQPDGLVSAGDISVQRRLRRRAFDPAQPRFGDAVAREVDGLSAREIIHVRFDLTSARRARSVWRRQEPTALAAYGGVRNPPRSQRMAASGTRRTRSVWWRQEPSAHATSTPDFCFLISKGSRRDFVLRTNSNGNRLSRNCLDNYRTRLMGRMGGG